MIPGIEKDEHGFPCLNVTVAGYRSRIYQHGAHLTHYGPIEGDPLIFLSEEARFQEGQAIRGGIPIICPWFGDHPTDAEAPAHGLVRARPWEWAGHTATTDQVTVVLTTRIENDPHYDGTLDLALTYTISKQLDLNLSVVNSGDHPVRCETAFHPYFHVGDVRQIKITGLQGATYLDKEQNFARCHEAAGAITIDGPTDRIYLDAIKTCTIEDPELRRKIVVTKKGSNSTIVWNPWVEKSRAFKDFGDDEWPGMVCVEQANAADNALILPPGQQHVMGASYSVEPM